MELTPNTYLPAESLNTDSLQVMEMYQASGQGEGFFTGVPSVFLRLAGCPVGCHFCDTKYTWSVKNPNATWKTWKDICAYLAGMNPYHLVVTGGEPLYSPWEPLREVITRMSRICQVTVETSGNFDERQGNFEAYLTRFTGADVLWSISPKLPSSGAKMTFTDDDLPVWSRVADFMQFKFVYSNLADIEYVFKIMEQRLLKEYFVYNRKSMRKVPIIFQPATPPEGPTAIKELTDLWRDGQEYLTFLLSRQLQSSSNTINSPWTYMVRPQSHVLIYGHKRLV